MLGSDTIWASGIADSVHFSGSAATPHSVNAPTDRHAH